MSELIKKVLCLRYVSEDVGDLFAWFELPGDDNDGLVNLNLLYTLFGERDKPGKMELTFDIDDLRDIRTEISRIIAALESEAANATA